MRNVNDWSDITVGQYQEMQLVESETELGKFIECISIALDCDPQDIRDMPYKDYVHLQSRMGFLSKQPLQDIQKILEIDGVKYGIEPDMNLISTGVFIDAEQFKQDSNLNLHNILALIYRPITKWVSDDEYEIEPHMARGFDKRANLFKNKLSIDVVFGATLFFSVIGMELSVRMLESFTKEVMEAEMTGTMSQTHKHMKKNNESSLTNDMDSTT